jgi:hypothetical protein
MSTLVSAAVACAQTFSLYVSNGPQPLTLLYWITALYSYEYIITFDQEISCIWTQKWSLATLIFAVNRHMNLAPVVLGVIWNENYTVSTALRFFVRVRRIHLILVLIDV